jgi:hypothetical protein
LHGFADVPESLGAGGRFEVNGAFTGDGSNPRRQRVVGKVISAKATAEKTGVVEIHPDRSTKRNWIGGNSVGDHLQFGFPAVEEQLVAQINFKNYFK